ncbi:MAG: peptide deformylase [Deltaproteobacteria bacterium]|nr:MAG: peptide deformylase [Deltaproteobacteria bacterium]TMQ16158.1 MAG: peptide deformylase [Deltaproteobacteria bacterium]
MTYKIVQVGDPVLRRRARELTPGEIATPAIQDLIAGMRDTMRDAPGVGLAAPQVGESIQLVVIEDPPQAHAGMTPAQLAERERAAVAFHVLINPRLTVEGDDEVAAYEGCLSFSGFTMIVPRWRRVRVEALDERGEPVVKIASGWYARILQHEIDHLRGVLCCDRMESRTLATHDNHLRHWRNATVDEARAALGPMPVD